MAVETRLKWTKDHLWMLLSVVHVYFITFGMVLPMLYKDVPFSAFYSKPYPHNEMVKKLIDQNYINYKNELHYIQTFKVNSTEHVEQKPYRISVGIVTVKRVYGSDSLGYLTQVLASLHRNLNSDIGMFVCDVYAGPGIHVEARNLSKHFKTFLRFEEPSPAHVIMDSFEKEKEDYTFCMQKLINYSTEFILMLEDDAVPIENFIKMLNVIILKLNNRHPAWGFLKLFYPPRWQGFSFIELRKIYELICIGFIGFVCFGLLYAVCNLLFFKCYRRRYKPWSTETLVILILGFVYSIFFALLIGRQNILEMQRKFNMYDTVTAPDCCSPAILYKNNIAEMLIEHFRKVKCSPNYPLDKALDQFREVNSIGAYLVEPSLVKHIGMVSTLKGVSRNLQEYL